MNQGPQNPIGTPGSNMAGPYTPGAVGASSTEYEFNDAQNAVISQAAVWARLLGIFLIITGVAALLNCNVITCGINIAVGSAFIGAASSFKAVVDTQGADIPHMMMALTKLRSAFKIRVIVVIVGVALVAVAFGLMLLLLLVRASSSS